jgi:hypothetical protein
MMNNLYQFLFLFLLFWENQYSEVWTFMTCIKGHIYRYMHLSVLYFNFLYSRKELLIGQLLYDNK